jgi:amino acid transporter
MADAKLIEQVIGKLRANYWEYEIVDFLRNKDIPEDEITAVIDAAKAVYHEERVTFYKKQNKLYFILWTSLTVLCLAMFLFVLPAQDLGEHSTILSIIGAALFFGLAYPAIAYSKSWRDEFVRKHETPNIDFSFFPIFFIPAVIVFFIFSWRFESASDRILRDTKVEATGKVISGSSTEVKRVLRSGGVTFSTIVVEFMTEEGNKVIAYEDVSSYEFQQFYIGQEVNLVYSKTNPKNIDLLVNAENVRELMDTQERQIDPSDLIALISTKQEDVLGKLNKIMYGWNYNGEKSMWINEKHNSIVMLADNEVRFIASSEFAHTFPTFLTGTGFRKTSTRKSGDILDTGEKTFQKGNLKVSIIVMQVQSTLASITTIHQD